MPLALRLRNSLRLSRCTAGASASQQEQAMQRPLFVFLSLIAAACVACDSKPGTPPDPPPPPSRFSVHQIDSTPGDGGMLAYGEAGKVQLQYTVQSGTQVPPPNGYYGPINLPPQANMPAVYEVVSCLSADGGTCLTDGSRHTVVGDGTVWNSLALSESFRGRLSQTGFVIHQLTMTRHGLLTSTKVVAREVGQLRWHFQ
jgi:hypothetical protein